MKRYVECIWMLAGILWILVDKEQRRQYNYDLGYGEIDQ